MTLTHKQSKEALEHVLTNLLEFKSGYPIWKNLIHNDCDCDEDFVNTADMNIWNLRNKIPTKELEYLSLGHQNLIR